MLASTTVAVAQNYATVDTKVASYPTSFPSVEAFAERIEKDFTKDADKVRAAYFWIATNIKYSYMGARGRRIYPRIKIKTWTSQEDFEYKYNKVYAKHALQAKSAVCEGYAQLLFYVCEALDIKAKVISGNAKTFREEIGKIPNDTDHAWNAVFFNNQWNLIDATWSTGNEEGKPGKFDFTDSYFCTAPEKLILTHFPEDEAWQLLEDKKSKKWFYNQPLFYEKYLRVKAALAPNMTGILNAKMKDSISLQFTYIDTTKNYYYSFTRDEYIKPLKPKRTGDVYVVKVPFNGTNPDYLGIYANNDAIMEFRIIPKR